jgi:2,4-diaminopentanoate dehydrogenase
VSHRIVQWGTGNVGYHSLLHLIQHPQFELVGLHAYSAEKLGKDAADIIGLTEKTGVIATNDIDALLAIKPDAVVYTANGERRPDDAVADLVRILSAGINVVSTALIYLIYPQHGEPRIREPLEEACRIGNSTLFVNGIDPGFSGDILPLAALQIADQIEGIRIQEVFDYGPYEDAEFTGYTFGFGQPEAFDPVMAMPGVIESGWGGMIKMVAEAIGVQIDSMEEIYERCFAQEAYECAMMKVPIGGCSAVRFQLRGIVDGKPLITAEHVNRLGADQAPDWPQGPDGEPGVHRCTVTGNPSIKLECFVKAKGGDHIGGGVKGTALRVINAIPAVCAHRAGMIHTLDLPYTPSQHII